MCSDINQHKVLLAQALPMMMKHLPGIYTWTFNTWTRQAYRLCKGSHSRLYLPRGGRNFPIKDLKEEGREDAGLVTRPPHEIHTYNGAQYLCFCQGNHLKHSWLMDMLTIICFNEHGTCMNLCPNSHNSNTIYAQMNMGLTRIFVQIGSIGMLGHSATQIPAPNLRVF